MAPESISLDRARAVALQALKRMHEMAIAPTPEHFATWYTYYAGANPDLVAEVNRLDDRGGLDASITAQLHDTFLGTGRERKGLQNISDKIEAAMRTLMIQVGQVERGAQDYGKALNTLSGELSAHSDEALAGLVGMVIGETERMALLNRELEERLLQSGNEIKKLREDLESVRVEATTDGLTGLANRKAFDSALRSFAAEASERGSPLALLILDIDFFKKFNDTHGHQTGDQVLRLVAKTMQASIPAECMAARMGGEEFCVLVPRLGMEKAVQIAETIRMAVGSKMLKNRKTGAELGLITLSVGVSLYQDGEPLTSFVERSDEALYLAKRTGRNRVCTQIDLQRDAFQQAQQQAQ